MEKKVDRICYIKKKFMNNKNNRMKIAETAGRDRPRTQFIE